MNLFADLVQLSLREPTFKCGHPLTEKNTRQEVVKYFSRRTNAVTSYQHARCKTCHQEQNRAWWHA